MDKAKAEAGIDFYYKNQTGGFEYGRSLGLKIAVDASFVIKQAKIIISPVIEVKTAFQNKVGGSFFLDYLW